LPTNPGVYLFLNGQGKVIYVGKALNLKKRVSSYFLSKDLGPKTSVLVSNIQGVKTIAVESEIEAFLLEAYLIKKYQPLYNSRLTDGKSYPYVYIDVKNKYPNVQVVRRPIESKNVFGPFPNAGDLKYVLKLIRKIFPYQSVVNHPKKKCLYNHLGLCPCPPLLEPDELKAYYRNIKLVIKFLKGDTIGVIRDLERERDKKSRREEFESALTVQEQISKIRSITTGFTHPFNYDLNPNLREDLASEGTAALAKLLNENDVPVGDLNRIECFDISNISGMYSVGSMVVFANGQRDSSSYRRFKIKNPPKTIPNDFAMMAEVLERRLKRNDWPIPDLIIVDGGKGQVSAVDKSVKTVKVPIIGLAKREEIIVTQRMDEIKLRSNSPEFRLITAVRNEAHRFAITYHKKLRSKMMFDK
jgi:excinuclease ABC subunit C